MKLGVFAAAATPLVTPEGLAALGEECESRGIESIWLPEHVVLFDDYESKYPYDPAGKFPAPADAGLLEPLNCLAFLAAHTSTVRLATGILLLPQRNPVYTAKEVANIDWLSGGRVDLGIGVGWLAEEFGVVNVPFPRRGARTDEYIQVLKTLWTDDVSSFSGEFYDLPECRMYPKPVQDPHPPIHVGGESDAALRRVARHGDAWYTFNRTPDELVEPLATLDELLAAEGRSRDDIELSVCPYLTPLTPETVVGYQEAGVDRVIAVVLGGGPDDLQPQFDALQPCLEAARGVKDLAGRVAVVTGAGSGIGRGIAERCAANGMRVVAADIEADAAAGTEAACRAAGAEAIGVVADVTDPASVEALADRTWSEFGGAGLVCANAGVWQGGLMWERSIEDWQWVLGVNLWGVVHTVRSFVPRMLAGGEDGHVVVTSSLAGLFCSPFSGPYQASKFAAFGLAESLAQDLAASGSAIGASVLCPGAVNTQIGTSTRNRPAELGEQAGEDTAFVDQALTDITGTGLDPTVVGDQVLAGVQKGEFLILTHDRLEDAVVTHTDQLLARRLPKMPDFT